MHLGGDIRDGDGCVHVVNHEFRPFTTPGMAIGAISTISSL
jgi:hypothetical protein